MCSPGISGEGELRGQLANPDSPGKIAVKTECVCVLSRHTIGCPAGLTSRQPKLKKVNVSSATEKSFLLPDLLKLQPLIV